MRSGAISEHNTLYYGDNLSVLREYVTDESVDLVYLDPPFNSNASYNVLFKEKSGEESPSQIRAFTDSWQWTQEAERTFEDEIMLNPAAPAALKEMISGFRQFLGSNAMMAYIVMMAPRLVELQRVLKPRGSVYLHCDPTASHYLKILMDSIFGPRKFRTEISWRRTSAHNDARQGRRQYGNVRDSIFFFTKGTQWTWNWQYTDYTKEYVETFYRFIEEGSGRRYRKDNLTAARPGGDTSYEWRVKRPNEGEWEADLTSEYLNPVEDWEYKGIPPYRGRYWAYSKDGMTAMAQEGRLTYARTGMPSYKRYLDEMPGVPLQNDWSDIRPASRSESLGFKTQKPQKLLERIIMASSNEGDVVLDPFCGCGTAVAAAEKLKRRWAGVDITHLAVALMKNRLKTGYDLRPGRDYTVVGEPLDVGSARALAQQDRYQFQFWAISLLEARPREHGKRGADRGIDGVLYFIDGPKRVAKRVIIQVKSGRVSSSHVRDLRGAMEREKAVMGLFITLEEPTREMQTEAFGAGSYRSDVWQRSYPRLQIRTVGQLLAGEGFQMPYHPSMYSSAQRMRPSMGEQGMLMETPEAYVTGK